MELTLEIIRSYGFSEKTNKPDWDDVAIDFTLPNGLVLSTLTVCNNEPCISNSLEGLSGYVYIETKEELDSLVNKSFEDILQEVKEENSNFDISEYM